MRADVVTAAVLSPDTDTHIQHRNYDDDLHHLVRSIIRHTIP